MSFQSKVILCAACTFSAAIIGYVHYKQHIDREQLHEGVLKDVERRQRRKAENIYNLQKQIDFTKELKKENSEAYADEESVEITSSEEEGFRELASFLETKLNSTILKDIVDLVNKTQSRCPGIEDKLKQTNTEVQECLDAINLEEETFCNVIRNNLEKCSAPFRKVLVECLPEESKGLPIMGIKILKAVLDQACNSTVEEILELFNPCALQKDFNSIDTCSKVKNVFVQYRDKVPSKSLICSVLPNLKSCIKSHREASCKNPITKASLINFYEAIDGATATECQGVNEVK